MNVEKCRCGKQLPTHLAEVAGDKLTHVCSCERSYKVVGGKFVENGREPNPFARVKRNMNYMDKAGFLRKDYGDSPRKIRRAEKWIREILARGATVPEAMWDIKATFDTAFENVRYEMVQRKPRRRT